MDGDVRIGWSGNPFGIDLCSGFGIIAGNGMQVMVNRFGGVVWQQVQTAGKSIAQKRLVEPVNAQTTDGVSVHECLFCGLHGDSDIRAVVDMPIEIKINRVDTVLNLLKKHAFGVKPAFLMALGSSFGHDRNPVNERSKRHKPVCVYIQM